MSINVLLVEDDPEQRRSYNNSCKRWNDNGQRKKIKIVEAENLEQAENLIKSEDFDAAIVDLKLSGDRQGEASGNEVIQKIKDVLRCPVYVVSGSPNELSESFEGHKLIDVFVRETHHVEELFPKIVKRYSTGITKIMGRRGYLEEALQKVFWTHLSDAIPHWEEEELTEEVKEKQLLRYTLAHIQEILELNDAGSDEYRNKAETYIIPPVRSSLFPGAILKSKGNGKLKILITPACTIAQSNADFAQLVSLIELEKHPKISTKKKGDSRVNALKSVIGNSNDRFHFLPKFSDMTNNYYIDFQQLSSEPFSECLTGYDIVCGITPKFFKDIVNRFSAFYARQGSPDFDKDILSNELNESLPEPTPANGS